MTVKNRSSLFGWTLISLWISGLFLMTYVFNRDGGFRQFDLHWELIILGFFWIFGIAGASYFYTQPITHLEIGSEKLTLTKTWIFKKKTEIIKKKDVKDLKIYTVQNNDGDSYQLFLVTHGAETLIQQDNDQDDLEKLRKEILARL